MMVRDWLSLDRAVSSQIAVRGWEKVCALPFVAAPGAHDGVEVALVLSGVVKYEIAGCETIVDDGHVFVVPHGVEHRTSFLTPVRAVALSLGADFIGEVADAMGPEFERPALEAGVATANVPRVRALIDLLVGEVNGAGAGHTRAAEALAESLVIEILRHAPRNTQERARDPRVERAIAQMNASFSEPLGIDDLAKTARMSRFHFSRLFRDETGQAPYQYLLRVRLGKAQELLRGGHCSVTEAALASGFTDLSRFASMFKKHTGRRPSDFRMTNRTKRAAASARE
jgi:AraC family transcriptional regulator